MIFLSKELSIATCIAQKYSKHVFEKHQTVKKIYIVKIKPCKFTVLILTNYRMLKIIYKLSDDPLPRFYSRAEIKIHLKFSTYNKAHL